MLIWYNCRYWFILLNGGVNVIYITRHGQTDWNVQKKVMGRCDEPLNENGLKQAEETRKKLIDIDIDLIICSH